MKLLADVDTITSNLKPLTTSIDDFTSAVSTFNGASINCPLDEVSGVLDSYKSSISDDLNKLNKSSHDYNDLVTDCCAKYKANEEKTQTLSIENMEKIIEKCAEVTAEYEGSAAKKLTGLPSTELMPSYIVQAKKTVAKYNGCNIASLSNKQFLEYISAAAILDYEKSGILPSVTIAQAICESGWGNYAIGNNLFGIKCGSGWKGKRRNCETKEQSAGGSYYSTRADFRDYDTLVEGISDHSDLLNNSRYKPVRAACNNNDAYEACRQLKACGYATSHSYAQTLISIINSNNLTQYDPKKKK